MKSIIRFSMNNNGIALCLLIMLVVGDGIYSLQQINIEKYPNIDIPYLTVLIVYPGASPELAMKEIGEPLEKESMNVDGVKNVYSDGLANAVYATMEFDLSVKMDDAEQLIRTAVDKIKLPETAEAPEYIREGPEPDPTVYSVGIYAKGQLVKVQSFVKDKMVPELESIEGVSSVQSDGLFDNKIFIKTLPNELLKYGLSLEDVKQAIISNNMSIPTGNVDLSSAVFPVRLDNELASIDEIKNLDAFI
ncbi:efflux RND transporter permease subunit [Bacillus sp. DJP31]|uniref:efflux RND transporter permease subunit n=1 Tax=Bacillus sp. DJP31 TaxID=3409789 RepID=UPI003BB60A19